MTKDLRYFNALAGTGVSCRETYIPRGDFNELMSLLKPQLRFVKNDETENLIFPIFSNHVFRPKESA